MDELFSEALDRWKNDLLRTHYTRLDKKLEGQHPSEIRKLLDAAFKDGRQVGQIEERMRANGSPNPQP